MKRLIDRIINGETLRKETTSETSSGHVPKRSRLSMQALEQRLMFDGAAVETTATIAAEQAGHRVDLSVRDVTPASFAPPASTQRNEIVFVESNVADYQTLLNGLKSGTEVHVLDATQDGLAQMAQILNGRSGIDAIHIFSHGSEATVQLGSMNLTAQNLQEHTADLATIGSALDANADILLYGCSVAAGSDGAALVDALAQATQADIAASIDLTGAASLGGNWVLEKQSGQIDASAAISDNALSNYANLLVNYTFPFSATEANLTANTTQITENGYTLNISCSGHNAGEFYGANFDPGNSNLTLAAGNSAATGNATITFTISITGYTFDFTSVQIADGTNNNDPTLGSYSVNSNKAGTAVTGSVPLATAPNTYATANTDSSANFTGISSLTISFNDTGGNAFVYVDNLVLSNITAIPVGPTVTDARVSISGASGTGGAYKIGDTVTATWNNTASGDNNSGVTGVTVDFSQFGGGSAVTATNSSGTWTATYTIVAGAIDNVSRNVSVTATNGTPTTTADTTNATVDNIAPTVSDARINISGASGTGGAFKIGDTVTATWNNTAGGDNNSDTISSATADFSQFGGGSAVAMTNSAGTWTATYTIVAGAIDNTSRNVSVTATDNGGNTTTTADTTNATVDNIAPTVSDARISISGASGTGGAFKIGDTVTATWNNTAGGDNNSDTISSATVDFSQFGGGSAVAMTNSAGAWTATYTIVAGAINNAANRNISVTATDNAGNTTTTADTSNATVDNVAPTTTFSALGFSADTGTSATDFITKTAAQTITATLSGAPAGSDIVYGSLDNGSTWIDITSKVSGTTLTWNGVTLTASSTLKLKVTDSAGNDGTVASQAYTLDTTAPTITFSGVSFSADTGTSATDFITMTAAQTITATLSGAPAGSDVVYGSLDNGSTWTDITSKVSGTTLTWNGVTLTASSTLKLKVTDNAGNDGTVASQAYTFDTSLPIAATPAASNLVSPSASTFTFTVGYSDTGAGIDSATIGTGNVTVTGPGAVGVLTVTGASYSAGTATYTVQAPHGGTWNSATDAGTYTIDINSNSVKDQAGNAVAAAAGAKTFTVNFAPTTTVSSAALSADTGTSSTDWITNMASQTISGTLSTNLVAGQWVEVSYDNGATWTNATTFSTGSSAWSTTTTLAGSNTFQVRVADVNGGGTALTHAYTLDQTAPTITFSALSLSADTGASSTDFITNTAAQTISATLSAGLGAGDIVYGSLDNGATWTDITSKVSGATLTWNGVTLTGGNTLKLKVTDSAANDGAITSQAYTLDITAPTITFSGLALSADTGTSAAEKPAGRTNVPW